jgi:ADP-ribose pyrophosphatase YjhB (NUDIX family)/RimJ/RimL family protein N-acetyltransferase
MERKTEVQQHSVILEGKTARGIQVKLRPLTENYWDILTKWNNDTEVLYFSESADITSRTPEEVRYVYRSVSQNAYCFIIEADYRVVGDCWLQKMNLPRVLQMYPGLDVRRIDLTIGEKGYWSQGIGTETIRLLTEFGFSDEKVDIIYNPDIADYNVRSQKAFRKVGYQIVGEILQQSGSKSQKVYDLAETRDDWLKRSFKRETRYQGAIVRDNQILLIRHREHESGRSYWILPGGGIEPGETGEDCVRREIKEETNLDVRVVSLLFDEPDPTKNTYISRKTYLCESNSSKASPGFEPEPEAASWYSIAEVKWFDLRDESTWDSELTADLITYGQLQRVRSRLGYIL